MTAKELNDIQLRRAVDYLVRHPESTTCFIFDDYNPLGQPQNGGYSYLFSREDIFTEEARRSL